MHNSLTLQRVTERGGTVVRSTGDGVLATFTDPTAAISAALELKRDLAASGITIRTGLHTGRLEVHEDGEISGIGVNIAARVQAIAGGEELLVSRTVRDLLLGPTFTMIDRGEHQLKGVDGAWRVYAVER